MDQPTRQAPAARPVAPRQARALRTRETLLDAVEKIVATEGGQAVTTTRIAGDTGVAVGTIYRYFADREALILAAYDRTVERIVADSAQALQRLPSGRIAPADAAKELLTAYLAAAETIPSHVGLLAEMRKLQPVEADQHGINQSGILRDLFLPFFERFLPDTPPADPTKLGFAGVLVGTMVDLYLVTPDRAAKAKLKAEIDAHVALIVERFA
ncbi:MAG TPA: TetR/AcrR family transcriptional regulator [Rhizobiaceae bacterium]|nr:TetR/AcrR family transcriptional regulator [Rhizobiaceae bacterium]